MTVRTAFWMNGVAVLGNIIVGIYDGTGIKLAETAATAQAGTNVIQSASIGPIYLRPGTYYMAIIPSSSTATVFRTGSIVAEECRHIGFHRQTEGSHALPATLTISGNSGGNNIIILGLSTQTVI